MKARTHSRAIAAVVALATAAGCQLIGGIDERYLGTALDGGPDATTEDAESPDGTTTDAGVESAAADAPAFVDAAGDVDTSGNADAGPDGACSDGGCAVTYPGEVLADGPLAYWRLDDTSGTTAVDSSGNGNDGTYYGDFTLGQSGAIASDPSDTGVYLNESGGQTGWVGAGGSFAVTSEFTNQSPFTIEAWIKPAVIDANYRGVMSNEAAVDAGKDGYVIYLGGFTSNGVGIGFDRWGGAVSTPVQDAGAVSAGSAWWYVVGTYDGTNQTIYVNGVQVATATSAVELPSFGCTFAIGATHCGTVSFYQGVIDEVAVYGTALSQARIQAHYQAAQ